LGIGAGVQLIPQACQSFTGAKELISLSLSKDIVTTASLTIFTSLISPSNFSPGISPPSYWISILDAWLRDRQGTNNTSTPEIATPSQLFIPEPSSRTPFSFTQFTLQTPRRHHQRVSFKCCLRGTMQSLSSMRIPLLLLLCILFFSFGHGQSIFTPLIRN